MILNVMMFFRDINFGVNFYRECQGVTNVRRLVTNVSEIEVLFKKSPS